MEVKLSSFVPRPTFIVETDLDIMAVQIPLMLLIFMLTMTLGLLFFFSNVIRYLFPKTPSLEFTVNFHRGTKYS